MNKNVEYELIIERAMVAFNCNNQEQLSELLKISPQNMSNKKRTGSFIKLIEKEAYKQNKNFGWIKTGMGNMNIESEKEPISEQPPYYGTSSENHTPEELLIRKTIRILSHDSVFKKALGGNIEAFNEGLLMREELQATRAMLAQLKKEHDEMKDQMKSMQERLGSVEDKESSG